jgi:hypothetical protein
MRSPFAKHGGDEGPVVQNCYRRSLTSPLLCNGSLPLPLARARTKGDTLFRLILIFELFVENAFCQTMPGIEQQFHTALLVFADFD